MVGFVPYKINFPSCFIPENFLACSLDKNSSREIILRFSSKSREKLCCLLFLEFKVAYSVYQVCTVVTIKYKDTCWISALRLFSDADGCTDCKASNSRTKMMNNLEMTVKKRFWACLRYYLRILCGGKKTWKPGIVGVPVEVRKLTSQIPVRSVAASATLSLVPHTVQFHCKFSSQSCSI